MRFWFRFVFPNVSMIRGSGAARAFSERIAPALDAWFGHCFERLCREALPLIYAQEGVTAGFEVGEYWSPATQIDVVGMRDDHWTDLGECKWGAVRSPRALETELEHKLQRYPNRRGATLGRRLLHAPQAAGQAGGRRLVRPRRPVCAGPGAKYRWPVTPNTAETADNLRGTRAFG